VIKARIYKYDARAKGFLDRARTALEGFKSEHDVQQLLIAALMLRFGIEARLFEYIEASLPHEKRQQQLIKISKIKPKYLLAKLTELNPDAKQRVVVASTPEDNPGDAIGMHYSPVTDSLKRIHGELGSLLHFNFFKRNPYWYSTTRAQSPGVTVLHAQDVIEQGIAELDEATRGKILAVPRWQPIVDQLLNTEPEA
jgi:hypothetical protein